MFALQIKFSLILVLLPPPIMMLKSLPQALQYPLSYFTKSCCRLEKLNDHVQSPLQTVPQRLSIKMVKSMPTKQPRVHSDADKISSTQNVSVSLLCAIVDGLIFYNSPLKPTRNATSSLCCPKSCASHQCHHSLQLLYIPRCSSTLFPVNYSEFERFKGAPPFIRLVDTVMRTIQCDRYPNGFFHH